ncbi:MAG TPA: LppX_LprAFG lipoprotein [Marmoricola sp.]
MIADRSRRLAVAGALLALAAGVTGCGGDDASKGDGPTATEALAAAKKNFDEAASVHLTLSTDSTPSSGDAVLGADGTLTRQPAFEGTVEVLLSGFNAEVPVVSVDDVVWAKLPLTPRYTEIDPAEYGAPDPADFADPEKGISGLLLEMDGVAEAGARREGKQVLTRYSGQLAGNLVAPIIPSADDGGTYEAVVGIDQDDRIVSLEVTGDFFAGGGDETYDLTFDDYDKSVKISAP